MDWSELAHVDYFKRLMCQEFWGRASTLATQFDEEHVPHYDIPLDNANDDAEIFKDMLRHLWKPDAQQQLDRDPFWTRLDDSALVTAALLADRFGM